MFYFVLIYFIKMDNKSKKELVTIIEEQNKTLTKYKARLHDIVESYKHLQKEKETLELSFKTLADTDENQKNDHIQVKDDISSEEKQNNLHTLKKNFGALTAEKSRIENELRSDRKKILQEKESLERSLVEKENTWFLQREKMESQIQEMRRKISVQQREREKEQHDHALMLKELQNILANERNEKERLDEQVCELRHLLDRHKPEKKAVEYEKIIEELKQELNLTKEKSRVLDRDFKKSEFALNKLQDEMDELKRHYRNTVENEKKQAGDADEKLKWVTLVNEKRIASLETRLSELSTMIGNYEKRKQEDQITIQRLKERITQLHAEHGTRLFSDENVKFWNLDELDIQSIQKKLKELKNASTPLEAKDIPVLGLEDPMVVGTHHSCQTEILHLKEEVERWKLQAESTLKEKYTKTALLSESKEMKDLKSKVSHLQNQLHSSKSQLKLSEEYHNKITTNLEKSIEELKVQNKAELGQVEVIHRTQIMDLEEQIQKQRERTLALLEEKEKEIHHLKTSFLSSFSKKESKLSTDDTESADQETLASLLSHSLISSKKDGHILHYVQELARKDVEISNLRQARIQTETSLRKLQQVSALMEDKYSLEVESLKSRIKLLESKESKDGTNVEYLKNVVLRFLKCNDLGTRQHIVNAIATVLHFTSSEVQEVKAYLR